jgi:hypothetical protein
MRSYAQWFANRTAALAFEAFNLQCRYPASEVYVYFKPNGAHAEVSRQDVIGGSGMIRLADPIPQGFTQSQITAWIRTHLESCELLDSQK